MAGIKEISSSLTFFYKYILPVPFILVSYPFAVLCLWYLPQMKIDAAAGLLLFVALLIWLPILLVRWHLSVKFASMDENGLYIANHSWGNRVPLPFAEIDDITQNTNFRPPFIRIHCKPHPVLGKVIRIVPEQRAFCKESLFEELYKGFMLKK